MDRTLDRRIKPRIECNYQATVEGHELDGTLFSENTSLVNLSASGLYLLANRRIDDGSRLSVTILLSNSSVDRVAPRLATRGIVVRTEAHENGSCGIAMKFNQYRFL